MSEPIIYVDRSEILEGKFEELESGINELAEFVETNEPQLIAYQAFFSQDRTRMTVIHVHADSASLAFHMRIAGRMFPKFAEFIRLEAIDIYGRPNDDLIEQLRGKAEMLGSGAVQFMTFMPEWPAFESSEREMFSVRGTFSFLVFG